MNFGEVSVDSGVLLLESLELGEDVVHVLSLSSPNGSLGVSQSLVVHGHHVLGSEFLHWSNKVLRGAHGGWGVSPREQ